MKSFAAIFAAIAVASGDPVQVPKQYFFTSENTVKSGVEQGCQVNRWNGVDPMGSVGIPWLTTIDCPEGATHKSSGHTTAGAIQIYLGNGSMTVNNRNLAITGSSAWIQAGADATVEISGFAYAVGAEYNLQAGKPIYFTNAYGIAPVIRYYDVQDAIDNKNATILHDIHINNGSDDNNCKDISWKASTEHTDPSSITVINCYNGKSFVSDHYHPMGALYIPYSGSICFLVDGKDRCITKGFPRWTSPILRYSESFTPETTSPSSGVADLVTRTGPWKETCNHPVVFSVTHFDLWSDSAGVPQFGDNPAAHGSQIAFRHTQHITHIVEYTDEL
eukprot:TRINITY_DN15083_c0_g1_i1.p1 TRINITY_DN15083_c0_g1~~TRINITY_DN15083_c0_g1_i1.p1  ORF type:complete len:352 (+),score=77.73 TRINITY_DN15083_c0_g1_i1:58-1056(+)